MKLVLMLLSLTVGTAAAIKSIELMETATAVVNQALDEARR
jgi:hypothetical protein